jgi:hypothetical protein
LQGGCGGPKVVLLFSLAMGDEPLGEEEDEKANLLF